MKTKTAIITLLGVWALCCACLADELHVPGQGDYGEGTATVEGAPGLILVDAAANGADDGSSWTDAYNYLQDALADANSDPNVDEIWVAQGVYKPDAISARPNGNGDRTATFQLINGVALKGGYAGCGGPDPNARDIELYETTLSGDLDGDDVGFTNNGENSYHVVTGSGTDPNTVLDGFTITAGNANGDSSPHWAGGGMYNSGVLNLTNCTFTGNWAEGGGGIYSTEDSNATLLGCTFSGNYALEGGGMYNTHGNATLLGCIFSANYAASGGGILNDGHSTLTNCTFTGNRAMYGGGIDDTTISSTTLTNCTFRGNSAGGYGRGGGMFQRGEATLTNCTFSSNDAREGGGLWTLAAGHPALTNCTFSGNWAQRSGGGMYCKGKSMLLTNCTFSGNWARRDGGGMFGGGRVHWLTNSIFWGNTPDQINGSAVLTTYSDIQGGWKGEGNIDADPCFVETGFWADACDVNIVVEPNDPNAIWVDGDYHLLATSPCIDTGDPNYITEPNETDLDGNPRVINGRIDMGAYEYWPPVQAEMKLTPQSLNCAGRGKYIKAHVTLPEGFLAEDVDVNEPALAEPVDVESEYMRIPFNDTGPVKVEIGFDRQEFCDCVAETGQIEVTVSGYLTTGQAFVGTDTVKIGSRGGR